MQTIFIIAFFFLLQSYAKAQQKNLPLFTLLTSKETGIDFNNEIAEADAQNVLAYEYFYNGGGVAIGDINNDGLPDIFFTANIKSNRLYLNQGNFKFKDITRTSGTGGRKDWKTGVTMADVNGDGWLDIYVCYSGKGSAESRKNELYINNHDLTFTESAKEYGLDDRGCSTQAIFFDYDRDGDLDCYVLNHNIKAFRNVDLHYLKNDYDSLAGDRLYRNDDGHFTDVSKAAGILQNPISFGLGVAVADINNDGWPDIYVSNDYTEQDYCYINQRDGTFLQREMYLFGHLSEFSMGCDIADINNDGLVDILTLDMLPEDNRRQKLLQGQENYELYQYMATNGFHYQFMRNMLQLNNGNGTFSEIGQLAGISNTDWSWAPLVADLDNDGYKDLFVTNGYMRDYTNKDFLKYWGDYLVKQAANRESINYMDLIRHMPSTLVHHYAFCNNSDCTYRDVSAEWGLDQLVLSNGAAYADLDGDGDLDLVVNNINNRASIFRNDENKILSHHYLSVQLRGSGKNTFGLGSKLFCYTGTQMQMLEQMPTRGYQSSVSEILHFGLGNHDKIDSLKITWPDGTGDKLEGIKADQVITFDQKNAKPFYQEPLKKPLSLFKGQKALIDFSHLQLEYNDFKRQPLMPLMLSQCGPHFAVGDINGDGLEDIFIGSSQGQSSELWLQQKDGNFLKQFIPAFAADSFSVTTSVLLFDVNGDHQADIYETSGGYNDYEENDPRLQDRLFLNDGRGNFIKAENALPVMQSSKSIAVAADINGDGHPDLFLGGRVVPGRYPEAPQSYLLLSDGQGNFKDVTEQWFPGLSHIGMITDAKWNDINHDGKPDLILVGEWMAPTILINTGSQFRASHPELESYEGWWNTLTLADIDGDGDTDLVIGNWGLNSQLHCSDKEPLEMLYKDFDGNGSVDPFICCYIQGRSYPYVSRDELLDQVYPLRKKFTSYESYADATIQNIFSDNDLKDAHHLKTTHLETMVFENRDGMFYPRSLPLLSQLSPVYKIVVEDLDKNGFPDILLLGNNEYPRLKIGKMDANFGTVLLNDGKGNFKLAGFDYSGLFVPGDTKDAAIVDVHGEKYLMVGINNGDLVTFKLNR